ncbi:MAG: LacI family transcriptional regulator [Chloroflexi bacterium]|nr:MAG: LacI family transcriptional regulator [Chloroflexota bacterium]
MTRRSSSVTIRDVARQAGVSVATVSRYINRNAPVSTEVADRLRKVMTDLRYVPHAAARHLASRKTRVIGILLRNLHNDFFVPLLNGVEMVVRAKGYNLIVATYHATNQNTMQPPIGPHNTDGLLIFADGLTDEDLANLTASGFPMVLLYRTSPPSLNIPSVTVENTEITYKLIEHLIQIHGKRRIVFMRGPIHQEDSVQREAGYKTALSKNGIPCDENLILNGLFGRDTAYQALHDFLGNGKQVAFDAIFAGDDDAAVGVLKALHEHGYKVPDDIAVVGFDDLAVAPFLNPALTTVRAPTESVGRLAAERLFSILENQPVKEADILPTEIIYRRSCGCHL